MVALKLPIFSGMVPSVDPHIISEKNAAYSNNVWLYSGALVGLPERVALHTLVNPAATAAFRIPTDKGNPTYLYDSIWMEFEDNGTDFVSAPVADDKWRRFYWTSPSQRPVYNTFERIKAGLPAWILGLPQPGDITVDVSGGTSETIVSRAYVTTFVTEYGEEGPASAPFLANGKQDALFKITVAAAVANDLGVNRNIKKIRIYRTITSAAGVATYYNVAELDATTLSQEYVDNIPDTELASKPILESTAWTAPPNLDGIVAMPNGIMAGYINNELYFSEPYRPHAWPAAYSLTIDYDVVGMAVTGQTLVVCTVGAPVTASGVNPASITTSKLAIFEPCLSKGSILPTEDGVFYTSPNGLIAVNSGLIQNITKQFMSRDQWAGVAYKGRVNAGRLNGAYYAFGAGVEQAFDTAFQEDIAQFKAEDVGSPIGMLIDPANQNTGFTYISAPHEVKSVRNDGFSGEVLIVTEGQVFWLDQSPGYKTIPYLWRSKIFQVPEKKNFAALKAYFYDDNSIQNPNPPNHELDQVYDPLTQKAILRVYADNKLIAVRELRKSGELLRLPSGYKAELWQVEFEGIVKIKSFQMATSVKELSVV